MTLEFQVLVGSVILGLAHLVLAAQLSNRHRGYAKWAAGARDEAAAPLPAIPARIERAYRNYLETLPYFVVVVLVAHLLNVHGALTQWGAVLFLGARIVYVGLYALGVWLVRSLVWNVAYLGIALIVVAIVRSG
jgi:uncharacterized MAPEG superfamily protein